jgi:arabinose-5-phosphate isomerase
MDPLTVYKNALSGAIAGIQGVLDRADDSIVQAVDLLFGCRGRVVVSGMGKCGHIGQKLVATFASTGTPALLLHPAEAIHGDLGNVARGDVALVLSNSGETAETTAMLPHLARMGVPVVAMTGKPESTLARAAAVVINTAVPAELDSLNLAPTASTTAMLAVGDALAVVLMQRRGFTKEDYAQYHPGGSLGQKLLCTVSDLMHTGSEIPCVHQDTRVRDALYEITSKRLGATFVVDAEARLVGILTDGDLRRVMQHNEHPLDLPVQAVMTQRPKSIAGGWLAVDALRFMEDGLITILPIVREDRTIAGVLHIHALIRAGIG